MSLTRVEQLKEEARKAEAKKPSMSINPKRTHVYRLNNRDICITFNHRVADLGEECKKCEKEHKQKLFECILLREYFNGDQRIETHSICADCLKNLIIEVLAITHKHKLPKVPIKAYLQSHAVEAILNKMY